MMSLQKKTKSHWTVFYKKNIDRYINIIVEAMKKQTEKVERLETKVERLVRSEREAQSLIKEITELKKQLISWASGFKTGTRNCEAPTKHYNTQSTVSRSKSSPRPYV